MSISNQYPQPNDLKNLELKTLDFLRNNPKVNSCFPTVSAHADKIYKFIKYQCTTKIKINFEVDFEISISGKPSQIFVGSWISSNQKGDSFECITYYFAIADDNQQPYKLIRKFHFDHVFENNAQSLPVYHLQYPGEQSGYLKKKCETKKYEKFLNPWLSEPRLSYQPMTLALIFDLIFRDFNYKNNFNNLINDKGWMGIIRKNEELVLGPFYSNCNKYFNNSHVITDLFTREFIYGR